MDKRAFRNRTCGSRCKSILLFGPRLIIPSGPSISRGRREGWSSCPHCRRRRKGWPSARARRYVGMERDCVSGVAGACRQSRLIRRATGNLVAKRDGSAASVTELPIFSCPSPAGLRRAGLAVVLTIPTPIVGSFAPPGGNQYFPGRAAPRGCLYYVDPRRLPVCLAKSG